MRACASSKGFTASYPQAGDKLVCLRNDPAKGLLNGSLWKVDDLVARDGEARRS